MAKLVTRKVIVESLVRSLREFGYPSVNAENVLTDYVYRKFALSQLKEAYEYSPHTELKMMINEIESRDLSEIKNDF